MRISDWSSDVCSSDLIDESQPLGAVDNLGGQLDEGLRIALEIRQPAALGQDGDETAPRELGAILKISQHVGQDDIALLDGHGAGRGGFGCEHAALPDGQVGLADGDARFGNRRRTGNGLDAIVDQLRVVEMHPIGRLVLDALPQRLEFGALQDGLTGFDRDALVGILDVELRSEEHTSELQSLMRISYAVFCLKKKK